MEVKIVKPVTVITPTIGLDTLELAIESVRKQTYKNITHLIVIDGPEYFQKVIAKDVLECVVTSTPFNVGSGGMYGHRIYASYPHLINTEYVAFLDEDNWYDETHIESLVDCIEDNSLDWAHSLRKVYLTERSLPSLPLKEVRFLANDCCEAIGRESIYGNGSNGHLVDTSTYLFRTNFLVNVCHLWHHGWGADRRFFGLIKDTPCKYGTSGLHTLNYRLPDMQRAYGGDLSFFEKGNELVRNKYGGKYPWTKI